MESFTNFILSKQSWTSDRDQQRRPGEDLNNVCSKVRSSNTQGLQTQDFQLVVIVVKGAMLSFWQLQQLLWSNILILFESHTRTQKTFLLKVTDSEQTVVYIFLNMLCKWIMRTEVDKQLCVWYKILLTKEIHSLLSYCCRYNMKDLCIKMSKNNLNWLFSKYFQQCRNTHLYLRWGCVSFSRWSLPLVEGSRQTRLNFTSSSLFTSPSPLCNDSFNK